MFNPLSFIVDSTVSLVFSPPHSLKDDELEWSRLDEDELLELQEKAQDAADILDVLRMNNEAYSIEDLVIFSSTSARLLDWACIDAQFVALHYMITKYRSSFIPAEKAVLPRLSAVVSHTDARLAALGNNGDFVDDLRKARMVFDDLKDKVESGRNRELHMLKEGTDRLESMKPSLGGDASISAYLMAASSNSSSSSSNSAAAARTVDDAAAEESASSSSHHKSSSSSSSSSTKKSSKGDGGEKKKKKKKDKE